MHVKIGKTKVILNRLHYLLGVQKDDATTNTKNVSVIGIKKLLIKDGNCFIYLNQTKENEMKPSQIWGFQRAGIICLNTYLIFSLNFVAIFAHGTPDRISDNIHSSHKQRYQDQEHPHSDAAASEPVSFSTPRTTDLEINYT